MKGQRPAKDCWRCMEREAGGIQYSRGTKMPADYATSQTLLCCMFKAKSVSSLTLNRKRNFLTKFI